MSAVPGTKGYEKVIEAFSQVSSSLEFADVNRDFLHLLPAPPANVLDAGAGVGQNSAAMSELGHFVVAVEPLEEFLVIARANYSHLNIEWINDSLPSLNSLGSKDKKFDFILLAGVWHHLCVVERRECIQRFAHVINPGGICAISLRNGPAGAGKHVFPVSCVELADYATEFGFKVVLQIENQVSKLPNKSDVMWSRVALEKI